MDQGLLVEEEVCRAGMPTADSAFYWPSGEVYYRPQAAIPYDDAESDGTTNKQVAVYEEAGPSQGALPLSARWQRANRKSVDGGRGGNQSGAS